MARLRAPHRPRLFRPALARNGATLNRHDAEGQRRLQACVEERAVNGDAATQPVVPNFRAFAEDVLDWRFSPKAYAGTPEAPMPPETGSAPADTGENLAPQFAVRKAATSHTASQHANSGKDSQDRASSSNGDTPRA